MNNLSFSFFLNKIEQKNFDGNCLCSIRVQIIISFQHYMHYRNFNKQLAPENWVDLTELFISESKSMTPGEMLSSPSFNLHNSMYANEVQHTIDIINNQNQNHCHRHHSCATQHHLTHMWFMFFLWWAVWGEDGRDRSDEWRADRGREAALRPHAQGARHHTTTGHRHHR